MSQKEFKIHTLEVKRTFLPTLVVIWIYSGFVRLYLFPKFAQVIYFAPIAVLLVITFRLFFLTDRDKSFHHLYLILLSSCVTFQILHFMYGDIDSKILVYGLSLYVIPFATIIQIPLTLKLNANVKCEMLILYALFPNFILVILQTVIPNSKFLPTLDNTDHLESANGVVRAFGTFSSTSGFSFYLTLCTAVLLGYSKSLKQNRVFFYWILLGSMYVLSGSRTVIFSLLFLLFTCAIFGGISIRWILRFSNLVRTILIVSCTYILVHFFFYNIYRAFLTRFADASSQENTLTRIQDSIIGFVSQDSKSLIGQGFGSRSIGAYSYTTSAGWIENDLPRIVAESGVFIGVSIIFGRWIFLSWLLRTQARHTGAKRFYRSLLIGAIFPVILFGQFMGQGSISLGTWISIYFCLCIEPDFVKQRF